MKLVQIYILVFTILLASKANLIIAQNQHKYLQQADSFMLHKNYDAAFKLYDRIWFFATADERQILAKNYLESAFQTQQFYSYLHIIHVFKNLEKIDLDLTQKLEEIASYFKLQNYEECLHIIESYKGDSAVNFQTNLNYFKLLCELKLNRKDSVIQTANLLKKYASMPQQKAMDQLLENYQKAKIISPKKVRFLSLVIPGLGQLFIKDYKNAVNAIALNGALIGAFLFTAQLYHWPQAALFWVFYVPHYYLGNSRSARDLTIQKNLKMEDQLFTDFKNWDLH